MTSVLEGQLADDVAASLEAANLPYDVTVTRTETVQEDPWSDPQEVVTDHACRGWVGSFTAAYIAGGLVQTGDVLVYIVAATLPIVPAPGDDVTVRGETYTVLAVTPDPALATYGLQARA